jgi:hypothetical protein
VTGTGAQALLPAGKMFVCAIVRVMMRMGTHAADSLLGVQWHCRRHHRRKQQQRKGYNAQQAGKAIGRAIKHDSLIQSLA